MAPTAPARTTESDARLPRTLAVGWAIGTIGPTTLLYIVNYSLMYFMTDLLGVTAAAAGLLIFSTRLFDLAFDLLVGVLSDRTISRWGRRRPWMFAGAILTAAGCALLFNSPAALAGNLPGALGWIGLCLVLYFAGYSMFNVPYLAMPAEMTTNYRERTRLMSLRVVFVSLSGFVGISGANALLAYYGRTMSGYGKMSAEIALLGVVSMLIPVVATRHAAATHPAREGKLGFILQARTVFSNTPFLVLILTKLLLLLSLSSITTGMLYFMVQVLHRGPASLSLYGLATNLGLLVSLPAWTRLGRRFSKNALFSMAIGLGIPLSLSWMLAGPSEPSWVFILRSAVAGMGAGGALLMGQALLPDTIEYDYLRTGLRREGIFSAIYSFMEKASFAFGPLIVGSVLALTGYVASKAGQPNAIQPSSALRGIYLAISVLPAVSSCLCIVLLRFYTLTEARLKAAEAYRATHPAFSGMSTSVRGHVELA